MVRFHHPSQTKIKQIKKQSYIKKLRILKEKFGFEVITVSCDHYALSHCKWESFSIHVISKHLLLSLIPKINKLFKIRITMVFGRNEGTVILLQSENTYWKN